MISYKRKVKLLVSCLSLAMVAGVGVPAAAHAKRIYPAQESKPLKPRIVGGQAIGIRQAPWQVLV